MSLSRPVKFPLLKLPFLCIKCVVHNSDLFDIIYFASISNRTRRILKNSNYPLKVINVSLTSRRITIRDMKKKVEDGKDWCFRHHLSGSGFPLVLQRNAMPFMTSIYSDFFGHHKLYSYTAGDSLEALKMGIDFLIDVFGFTVKHLSVDGSKLSDPFELGISSVKVLHIYHYNPVNTTDLKKLLETIKVSDEYVFFAPISKDFNCDPQIFKCQIMRFHPYSAEWVTLELLCQFDVAQLHFSYHRFSEEDIVSYINYWFHSENRKLEHLYARFQNPISQEDFKIDHLNPMPFCEKRRNRYPLGEWRKTDISSGRDILRQDGLLATFFVDSTSILFYIWHKRFPDAINHN